MKYDEEQAEDEASVARNSKAKPKATKKTITPKKIIVIRTNRQAKKDEKEFKANNENNEAEDEEPVKKPVTRQSRRLLNKNKKESDSDKRSQPAKSKRKNPESDEKAIKGPVNKRQKITIEKASTPAKEVSTTTSSPMTDDWAATSKTATTFTSRKQPGRLHDAGK